MLMIASRELVWTFLTDLGLPLETDFLPDTLMKT